MTLFIPHLSCFCVIKLLALTVFIFFPHMHKFSLRRSLTVTSCRIWALVRKNNFTETGVWGEKFGLQRLSVNKSKLHSYLYYKCHSVQISVKTLKKRVLVKFNLQIHFTVLSHDESSRSLNLGFMDWRQGSGPEIPLGEAASPRRPSSGSSRCWEGLGEVGGGIKGYKHITVPQCCNKTDVITPIWQAGAPNRVLALWAEDDRMMSGCNDSNVLSALWVPNLKRQMACFQNPLDLFHIETLVKESEALSVET